MLRIIAAATLLWIILPHSAFGQTQAANTPAAESASDDGADSVTVTGKPSRRMVYEFYQELAANDFCPPFLVTPKGHSCAEVTYDIFDASGKHLGKCNVPIFRLYSFGFEYVAVTYDKFDCTKEKQKNRNLAMVSLKELFDPRTRDNTTFRKIGVMGIDQARELCKASSDLCVMGLFSHEGELSYCAMKMLWGVPGNHVSNVCMHR